MTFDPDADPVAIAARAAELSIEQLRRLRSFQKNYPDRNVNRFYMEDLFEVAQSNYIAKLMASYAVLMGYVTLEEASR